jgi:hypothetical protein
MLVSRTRSLRPHSSVSCSRISHASKSIPLALVALAIAAGSSPVTANARPAQAAYASDASRAPIIKIVAQIQRADYEGDRPALQRLYADLTPFIDDKALSTDANSVLTSRIHYWRGFALWRRAINGFNETVDAEEPKRDLNQAVAEFAGASAKDPSFVDAKVGAGSSLTFLAYGLGEKDPACIKELATQATTLLKEARTAAPDNPRLLWVVGSNLWYVPIERGGGQEAAMKMYDQGLAYIYAHKSDATDPLDPSWGEPEILMNLSWSNQHRTTPDLAAAVRDARTALALVPYWHYLRDILLPQILAAEKKS